MCIFKNRSQGSGAGSRNEDRKLSPRLLTPGPWPQRVMAEPKSDKELAFLHDLYIATDWGERFAALVDEHVKVPRQGRALYLQAGTGSHALALRERGISRRSAVNGRAKAGTRAGTAARGRSGPA